MSVIQVEQLGVDQRKALGIPDEVQSVHGWSVWECEPSTFDWTYSATEKAYIFEGKVIVKTTDGDVELKAGDFVTFPKSLNCTWQVLEKIRKVYMFCED